MYLLAEVFFYAGQRSSLPQVGYRPDAVFDNAGNYWGITFSIMEVGHKVVV